MNPVWFVATALAGGVGAAVRLFVDGWARARFGSFLPHGTLLINVTGSFGLGLLAGLAGRVLPAEVLLVLGTGLLGGYTTFSTASVETVRLLRAERPWAGLGTGLGMLASGLLAALAGLWLGGLG